MPQALTQDELNTSRGRRRAWRELMIGDHGWLRKFYDNTHEISPGKMWRTYQPSPATLAQWKKRGIKTIINLRGDNPTGYYFLEKEACEKLGLTLKTFRVFSRNAPTIEALHGAQKLFSEIEYPALIHCKSGADRAGLMATLYLFFQESVPLEMAMEQLSLKYGHIKQGKTGVLDAALNAYIDHAKTAGKSLSSVDDFFDWVDSVYDPDAIKENFQPSGWGSFLTETVLRRE